MNTKIDDLTKEKDHLGLIIQSLNQSLNSNLDLKEKMQAIFNICPVLNNEDCD